MGVQGGENVQLKIFNVLGKQVLETSFVGNKVNDVSVNFRTGVYIVQLETQKNKLSKKIIIE